jgi:hypothetical protein
MSCLERAITDGHAKLTGEGEHARPGRRRLRRAAGRLRAMRETRFETIPCVRDFPRGRGKLRPWRAHSRFHQSTPAGCGSVPLPVLGRATYRGGTPTGPQCQAEVRPGTAELRSNDLQPVSKEALIGAIKQCHQTLWAAGKLSLAATL